MTNRQPSELSSVIPAGPPVDYMDCTKMRTLSQIVAAVLFAYPVTAILAVCPPTDLNRDCKVDFADLVLFAQQWLAAPESTADFNGDDSVDMNDLNVLAQNWRKIGVPLVINEVMASNSTLQRPTG